MNDTESGEFRNVVSYLGLMAASIVVSLGTYWAFSRGGDDFDVFYTAWQHVLQGRGLDIYRNSPDRFLYAPGFAWIFSPLAALPRDAALAIWCFLKAALVGWMVREFSKALLAKDRVPSAQDSILAAGVTAWGVVLVARPLLIDFQYGQVNLMILGACVWALVRHLNPGDRGFGWDFLSWMVLAIAAVGKVFPLPLLAIPFWLTRFGTHTISSRKLRWERVGLVAGVAAAVLFPIVSVGLEGALSLLQQWKLALMDRGFPLESHNQSFGAFLHHYASGSPTEIIAQHRRQLSLGFPFFDKPTLALLSAAWTSLFAGLILVSLMKGSRGAGNLFAFSTRDRWIAMLVALLILPSHLVWKPYFVMGLPAAFVALRFSERLWPFLLLSFVMMNLSGFDVMGPDWGAKLEAASILLWAYLVLLIALTRSDRTMSDIRP